MIHPWQATLQDDMGNIVPLPEVTVWLDDGVTLASIYTESGSPMPNPTVGSLEGFVRFFAETGRYRVAANRGSDTTVVWVVDIGPVAAIRYDAAQTLTTPQQAQARDNIDAQPSGSYLSYESQALTSAQQKQVRDNIGGVGLGVDQEWFWATNWRALNTTYTNTTGKPIAVAWSVAASVTNVNIDVRIDASQGWVKAGSGGNAGMGIVPVGNQYRVIGTGTGAIFGWSETLLEALV